MYLFEPDTDPIDPSACNLLADLGLDVQSVRDALADDRTRRCPDREPLPHGSWREAEGDVNGGGPGREIDPDSSRSQPIVNTTNQGAQLWLSD